MEAHDAARWRQIDLVFTRALARPPAERARFLAAECAGDPPLRAAVRGLLEAAGEADDFWREAFRQRSAAWRDALGAGSETDATGEPPGGTQR